MLLAQRIVSEITDRDLPPGTVLASERQMLEEYSVARGTLREALRFLEIQGVLTIKPGPGGGPAVNGVEPRSLASVIALLLQLAGATFSAVLEARQLLEPPTAALAAERATPAQIASLAVSLEVMDGKLDDAHGFLEENRVFHDTIARASGNELFHLLVQSLSWLFDASNLGVEYDARRRASVQKAHRAIYEAVAAHDPEAAQEAMRLHIDEFARYLGRYYSGVLTSRLRWEQMLG